MTPEELEQAIRDLIMRIYCKKYVGEMLCIPMCSGEGWTVVLGMNNVDKPITISAQLPDDKFLKFFEEELNSRDWNTIKWFKGYMTAPNNLNCICQKMNS